MKQRLKKVKTSDRKGTEADGPFYHADHRRPMTRREFLGQGFITGTACVTAPSLLSLLGARSALAAPCTAINNPRVRSPSSPSTSAGARTSRART